MKRIIWANRNLNLRRQYGRQQMPTVYVINRSVHDFSKAEKFGQLVYLSNGAINKYATSKMARKFEEMLQDSAEEDYILITSLTVMNIIACSIFVCIHKKLNLLI